MKKVLLAAVAAFVCSTSFAQATSPGAPGAAGAGGMSTATKEELTGEKSQTQKVTGDRAQNKVDARKGAMPMANTDGTMPSILAMDTNGDGMISRREYDAYHSAMWKSMKQTKGMVSKADMDAKRKDGPN